ncbi:MAG: hypothetical protein RLZZ383_1225 [Pseudomonadota bacterium]|jgi:hypothetical protein
MTLPDRPLFLIGTGRCGSSLLLQLLGYHPDVAWMSHYTNRLPGGPWWAALHRIHTMPGWEGWLPRATSPWVPQATEHYRALRRATDGRFTAPHELTAHDCTPADRARLQALASGHVRAQGAKRFLMKHTGFARIDYLLAAFPDARFVHVERDGRAVAASLTQVDWWSGEAGWGWGALSDDQRDRYRESGYHELALAGLYWEVLMDALRRAVAAAPADRVLTVRYDALVADPASTLTAILSFADLAPSPVFDRRVAATPMTSDDRRWRKRLSSDDVRRLEATLAPSLARFGFSP